MQLKYKMLMPVAILLLLLLGVNLSSAEHYLFKAQNVPPPQDKIVKRLSKDLYLIKGPFIGIGHVVEPNYTLRAFRKPNDKCVDLKWELELLEAFKAWDLETGSSTVYVGVPDTGVNYNHPDLRTNLWRNTADCDYDGIDDDRNGYVDDCYGANVLCYPNGIYDPNAHGCNKSDALDDNGHGTHIAGIIGAVGNNGYLIPGILWNVKIIPCKFLDSTGVGDIAGEISCLDYFLSLKRKGLNIVAVNASYGESYPPSKIQREKILELNKAGILYISASGNEGWDNEQQDVYPCNYNLPNQICVGSVGRGGMISSFSNYGFNTVQILAPGENILSLTASPATAPNDCDYSLKSETGTSMATAFVTSAVALLKSKEPDASLSEVKKRILTSVEVRKDLWGMVYTCGFLNLYRVLNSSSNPGICVSEKSIDFGTLFSCGYYSKKLHIRNVGNKLIKLGLFTISGIGFNIQRDSCSFKVLQPLEECVVEVTFYPPTVGFYSGTLYGSVIDLSLDVILPITGFLDGDPSTLKCNKGRGCGGDSPSLLGSLAIIIALSRFRKMVFNNK